MSLVFSTLRVASTDLNQAGHFPRQVLRLFRTRHSKFIQRGMAVVPAPDGGYPGFNTAEGQSALLNLTGGVGNTAIGRFHYGLIQRRSAHNCR